MKNMKKQPIIVGIILILLTVGLSGCNEQILEEDSAPIINYFTATSTTVTYGNSTILEWSVEGATNVSIDNGIGRVDPDGSLTISPLENQTYILRAVNSYGSTNASIKIYVSMDNGQSPQKELAPIIEFFTATSTNVTLGDGTVLKWSVEGATNVSIYYIKNEIVYVNSIGSIEVFPLESKKYSLIAYNEFGTSYKYIYLSVT